MRKLVLCLGLAGGFALFGWDDTLGGQLVNVGDHRLFVHCTGQASEMAVVLENGLALNLTHGKQFSRRWKAFRGSVATTAPAKDTAINRVSLKLRTQSPLICTGFSK